MDHSEESRMKFAMILFALGVCYVSLPVTSQVATVGQTADAEPTPAAATEPAKPETADAEKNGAATKSVDKPADQPADKDDAAKKVAEQAESKPADKSETKKAKQ